MSESSVQMGRIWRLIDCVEARLERLFEHDRNVIWSMLTERQALVQWLAPGSIELRMGGAVHIDFADSGTAIESTVLQLDPPHLLAYSWSSGNEPERPLRWELDVVEEGTQLVLTMRLPTTEDVAKACAGFDAHLEMLAAALEGIPIRFPVDYYLQRRRAYQELQPK
jgi:uncharacterized protein YndB with AHSA1/START domain